MRDIRFDGLSDDTKILSIGSLFRKTNGSQWGVNLGLFPAQNKKSLTLSNAPVLVRKRVLNPSAEPKQAGYKLSLAITSTQLWEQKTLAEYPIQSAIDELDKNQRCFYFLSGKGVQIFLPQFELARVLFFHDGYLSRTALDTDCLKAEFDIQHINPEEARINVLPSSSYPLKSLDDYGARRLLSWLLIDQDARTSFETIGRYQKLNGYERNGYRFWDFQFEPPELPCARFDVRGHFDQVANCMFVYEITGIRDVKVNVPDVVEIYHPKFKEYVRGHGSGRASAIFDKPVDEHTVHNEAEASSDNQHTLLYAPSVAFEFSKPFETRKVADKKQQSISGRTDEETGGVASGNVSVNEPTSSGTTPCAEWDSVTDETDDIHLYANKFDCFHRMLDELSDTYGCEIKSKTLRKLPPLSRCKKHLLTDSNPRCIAVVEVVFAGTHFHILEVDTSDAMNLLSTQLLKLKSREKWDYQLERLEKALLKSSLRWPNSLLVELCGEEGVVGVPHPRTNSTDKGQLVSASVAHWAARFHSWMVST
ncbi:MAG: Tn7-like element transposition protein TnsE [Methylobacter sp.]